MHDELQLIQTVDVSTDAESLQSCAMAVVGRLNNGFLFSLAEKWSWQLIPLIVVGCILLYVSDRTESMSN